MAKYKVPSFVSFITEFPMNGAGKIIKYKLREMAIEEKNLKDAAAIETA
jgi:fatty-acyl-CoA synthase